MASSHRDRHISEALRTRAPPKSKARDTPCSVTQQLELLSGSQAGCEQLRPPPARSPRISLLEDRPRASEDPKPGQNGCMRRGSMWGAEMCTPPARREEESRDQDQGLGWVCLGRGGGDMLALLTPGVYPGVLFTKQPLLWGLQLQPCSW